MSGSQTSNLSLPPGYSVGDVGEWKTLPWPDDQELKLDLLDNSLGPALIDWAEWRTDEPGLLNDEGEPWRFTDGQARFLILWYAFDKDGRFIYRRGIRRGSKGPIAHDTPVMTPDGWTTHGELKVGSRVFAEDGSITTVTALLPEVMEPMYRLKFRDGATVDCTGSHRWPVEVFTARGKRERKIVTVNEMLEQGITFERKLTTGKTKATRGGVARFKALTSPAVDGAHVDMPIHPYAFGYWLGDGDKDCSRVTSCWEDMQNLMSVFDDLGVEHGESSLTHGNTYRLRFGRGVAQAWLREIGVLNNKHIPMEFKRASLEQRWAILQGLVDSDGTVSKDGQVEISLKNDQLADDVFELCVSLGLMPNFKVGRAAIGDKRYTDRKRIHFTPAEGEIVSRLPRKAARCHRKRAHKVPFSRSRTIVDIERIETRPARCLTVEHDSHVYLVGERNVPTCNTGKDPFAAAMCCMELLGPSQLWWDGVQWVGKRHDLPLVQIASNSEAQSKALLRVANSMLGSEAVDFYQLDKGQTATYIKGGGARMEVLTASERSAEGNPATFCIINETHHMTDSSGGKRLASVARRNVGKSKRSLQARIVELTNAHSQGNDSVGERSFEAWQKQVSGKYKQLRKDILYDSIEADPRLDFYDEKDRALALKQAYSDAPWADLKRLGDEIVDPELSAAEAIRFYLNGVAEQEDAYVAAGNFAALADPSRVFVDGDQIALFLDCSKSTDATALMGCRIKDGFNQTLGVWQRPRGPRGEGFLVDRAEVDARVREVFDTYKVVWFGVDPSPAKDDSTEASYWKPTIDQWHRDFRRRLRVWATPGNKGNSVMWDMRLSSPGGHDRNRKFAQEVEVIQQAVDEEGLEGPFRHDGDPALVAHVNNTRARFNKFGLAVGKKNRDSTQLVDLCVAMIGANVGRREALNSGKVRAARSGNSPRFLALK